MGSAEVWKCNSVEVWKIESVRPTDHHLNARVVAKTRPDPEISQLLHVGYYLGIFPEVYSQSKSNHFGKLGSRKIREVWKGAKVWKYRIV